jgi:pimeloyl-ACP methyl ester carboxylesterase
MNNSYQFWLLLITTTYHFIATLKENITQKPLGKLIDLGSCKLHLYSKEKGSPTVIIDHSLGGIEGYFLIESIAKLTQVCIYDRSGYGWSSMSFRPRTSLEIVRELDLLLTKAQADKLRDRMHRDLSTLSTDYTEIVANRSSHFVWIDEPEIIVKAIQKLLSS